MKCHLRDLKITEDDYPNSPHVQYYIRNGMHPICNHSTGRQSTFTNDIKEVTCKACIEKFKLTQNSL